MNNRVPPKPVHLQPTGQQKIPPAPSRPLPADPKLLKSLVAKEEATQTSADISRLIKKFESIRQPIDVHKNQVNLAFRMEPGMDLSKQYSPSACDVVTSSASPTNEDKEMDDRETGMLCSTEVSNTDIMKIKELNIEDTTSTEDSVDVSVSKTSTEDLDPKDSSGELNGNGKIPNRDSGIDSPSCSVAGETFMNEDGAEQKKTTVTANPAEMDTDRKGVIFSAGAQKRDSAQDEDSDIDEGSSEEQETVELPKLECVDINKVK
uniref:Uncharacterized protein n=1 Tax=Sphaerodactylus townsendi TaxID=933632 RepID=A0ACB8EHG3_9SAUR